MRSLSMALVASMMTAGAAQAASISYTASVPGQGFSIVGGGSQAIATLSVAGFNPGALGVPLGATLDSVTISFVGDAAGTFVAFPDTQPNGTASAGDNFVTAGANFVFGSGGVAPGGLTGSGGTAFSADLPEDANYNRASLTFVCDNPPSAGGDPDCGSYGQNFDTSFSTGLFAAPTANYDGVGLVNFAFIGFGFDQSTTTTGIARLIQNFTYNLDATVTYQFSELPPPPTNEVPLPAALPLFAAALGGLALVRRRKN